ncbi:MAG: aryl-sulfate sulfotransferase [Desulfopila sp.]
MKNVVHICEHDLITQQTAAEQQMLAEFAKGEYTIDNPLIKVNPYLISPCAAVLLFRTPEETAITITVRGRTPEANISRTYPKAKEHILPVLGLYPGYDNIVEIAVYQGEKRAIFIRTEPKDYGAAELIHLETTADYLQGDLIFVTPASPGDRLTGFDCCGDIRWYADVQLQMGIKRLQNGHFLVGAPRLLAFPYFTTGLYEMDLVGKVYKEFLLPGGYHHDQFEMPDGDLLVLSGDFDRDTLEDMCVLVDRESGEIKKVWDYTKVITPGDSNSGLASPEDWFHNNSVWYDPNTESISLSGRHVDAIVNLDYASGAINWILGDPEGWSAEKQQYMFTPPEGKPFTWQYAQHAASILPCGDVLCFDNGTKRSKNPEKYIENKHNYSRGVRFAINTREKTLDQVWQFGQELGPEFFSQHISNVDYYGPGHYLIHAGGIQLLDGAPAETILVGEDPYSRRECRTICLVNDEVVLDMLTRGNYYRAKRLSLYHGQGGELELGAGKKLGALSATKETVCPGATATDEPVPAECLAHIVEHEEYIFIKARFALESQVFIELDNGSEVHGYAVKTADKFAMRAGAPYIEGDERNTSTRINKQGLSGRYAVNIVIDGKKYRTGEHIDC